MESKISKLILGALIIGIFLNMIGFVAADVAKYSDPYIKYRVCSGPDLTITNITSSTTNATIGQSVTFSVIIKNIGTNKSNSSSIEKYENGNSIGTISIPQLNSNTSTSKQFTWLCSIPGTYTIKVKADSTNTNNECNENNNEKSVVIICSKKPNGESCTSGSDCESGRCIGGKCVSGIYCDDATPCTETGKYCENHECKDKKANGMLCTDNNQCNTSFCNNNFCCVSGTCCGSNQNCPSDKPICTNSQCNPCTNDTQCKSDKYCENGECKSKKNNDIHCSAAKECLSNYCVHNICRATETFCKDNYCDTGEAATCPVDCGCKSNENCNNNQICNTTLHQCQDLTCQAGQQVQNHACVQISGYCISNENCSDNQICNTTAHQCESAPSGGGIGGIPFVYIAIIVVFVIVLIILIVLWKKPSKLSVIANPTEIPADGKSASTIVITIKNLFGKAISVKSETSVTLSTTLGSITNQTTISKDSTSATAVLTSSTTPGTGKVSVVASIGATQEGMLPKEASSIGGIGAKIPKISGGKKTLTGGVEVTFTLVTTKRYCMHCGALMMSEKDPCPRCGKLPPSGVDTKNCPNCNAVIPITAKFCRMCGAGQQK